MHEIALVFCKKLLQPSQIHTQLIEFKGIFMLRESFAGAKRIKASIMSYEHYQLKSYSSSTRCHSGTD